jgi:hypothetical protein
MALLCGSTRDGIVFVPHDGAEGLSPHDRVSIRGQQQDGMDLGGDASARPPSC